MAEHDPRPSRLSARSVLVGVLATLAVIVVGWTYVVYTFLRDEQELRQGLAGDDTDVYRDWFLICLALSTVLVVAFLVAWRWPNLVRRWREERAAWAEMRAEGRRSSAP